MTIDPVKINYRLKAAMWLSEDYIVRFLESGTPQEVMQAVLALGESDETVISFCLCGAQLPMLDPALLHRLASSGEAISEDVQKALLRIVWHCDCMTPPLNPEDKNAFAVAVALRGGNHTVCYEIALRAKTCQTPEESVSSLMRELSQHDLGAAEAARGAQYLVSTLLDGKAPLRAKVLDELNRWPDSPQHQAVLDYVTPQLTDAERSIVSA